MHITNNNYLYNLALFYPTKYILYINKEYVYDTF